MVSVFNKHPLHPQKELYLRQRCGGSEALGTKQKSTFRQDVSLSQGSINVPTPIHRLTDYFKSLSHIYSFGRREQIRDAGRRSH